MGNLNVVDETFSKETILKEQLQADRKVLTSLKGRQYEEHFLEVDLSKEELHRFYHGRTREAAGVLRLYKVEEVGGGMCSSLNLRIISEHIKTRLSQVEDITEVRAVTLLSQTLQACSQIAKKYRQYFAVLPELVGFTSQEELAVWYHMNPVAMAPRYPVASEHHMVESVISAFEDKLVSRSFSIELTLLKQKELTTPYSVDAASAFFGDYLAGYQQREDKIRKLSQTFKYKVKK